MTIGYLAALITLTVPVSIVEQKTKQL